MTDFQALFGAEGALAQGLDDFEPRPGQAVMAEAVARTLSGQGRLVAEAGTGTGKTLAYLIPALASGLKVIVSTGTKALQDQLFHKDLPLAAATLATPVRTTLLKGRANYLCLHRLDLTQHDRRLHRRDLRERVQAVREWSGRTDAGDLSEIGDTSDGSSVWPAVSSTTENCLGAECSRYSECFVLKARKRAQEADVVVVNHHLLFADLALREQGFGALLPGADAVILDEAHQLPDVASGFFGSSVSLRQMLELVHDGKVEHGKAGRDNPALDEALGDFQAAASGVDEALGSAVERLSWEVATERADFSAAFARLVSSVRGLENPLEQASGKSKGLANCYARCMALSERVGLLEGHATGLIRWIEKSSYGFTLHATPVDIAPSFQQIVSESPAAWVMTSATLAVNRNFAHFTRRLGFLDADELLVDSPFDYRRNALLYLPDAMPDPNGIGFSEALVGAATPLLKASGGGAFFLCTSYRAVQEISSLLQPLGLPLLVQGSVGRTELLSRFREHGSAVLVGTSSFWEGVDVRGTALRLVVIDRLPFGVPADPVLQARLEALREQGDDPFRSYQLPQAVIALKQGAGRLIRHSQDRGVLMICDPRIRQRSYGKTFLNSLPPMPPTSDCEQVCEFLAGVRA